MNNTFKNKYLLILNVIGYVAVIVVNVLSQIGYLGGKTTSEISDKYVNLFTPSGITFSIWGIIYVLLGIYTIYMLINRNDRFVMIIAPIYFMTSVLNIMWILAWHYTNPLLSLIAILLLLGCLTIIVNSLKGSNILTRTTFSIYLAWILVASMASIFVYLTSILKFEYDSFFYIVLANIFIALVGLLVITVGRKAKDIPYILTLIWGLAGILNKHISSNGFNRQHLSIIVIGIVVVAISIIEVGSIILKEK